jgi:hypothetical protein
MEKALSHIEAMSANMGGNNLMSLSDVIKRLELSNHQEVRIFLLTNGREDRFE